MSDEKFSVYELCVNPENPAAIADAANQALLKALQNIINDMKKMNAQPGLTWAQIDYLIEELKKKKCEVMVQQEVF